MRSPLRRRWIDRTPYGFSSTQPAETGVLPATDRRRTAVSPPPKAGTGLAPEEPRQDFPGGSPAMNHPSVPERDRSSARRRLHAADAVVDARDRAGGIDLN